MLGLAVCILTVKVKGQFLHQDLYRDGVNLCNSPAHLASECPQKSSSRGFTPKPVSRPQVNFCRTKQKADPPKQSNEGARVTRDRSVGAATCSNCNLVSGAGLQYESSCESSAANAVVPKCDSAVQLAKETTWIGNSQDHVQPSCDDWLMSSQSDIENITSLHLKSYICLQQYIWRSLIL